MSHSSDGKPECALPDCALHDSNGTSGAANSRWNGVGPPPRRPTCNLCGSDDPKVRRMVQFGCGQKQDYECDGPFHDETKP